MWIGSCFKACKESEAEVHHKIRDSVPAFHSSLKFLMSGIGVGGQECRSTGLFQTKPCVVSYRSKYPLAVVKATRFPVLSWWLRLE